MSFARDAAFSILVAAAVAAPLTSSAQGTGVGLVVAMRGDVTAQAPGQPERPVTCGDIVHENERVATGVASRVAILTGDVYAQLFVLSAARFGRGADGTAELALEQGRMRVIDPRGETDARPVHVTASAADARFAGNDVDAYVLGPPGETNGMICSERVDLKVGRAAEGTHAKPGQCAIASIGKPLYRASVPSERIALGEAYECVLPVAFGPLEQYFDPTDVAAGQDFELPVPDALDDSIRDACDDPGSGCAGFSLPVDTITPFPSDPLPGGD